MLLSFIWVMTSVVPTLAQDTAARAAPRPQSWTVPAETTIPVRLENSVSSKTAYAGQAIYCTTVYPITVHNRIVIPAGTYVKGALTQVVRPGHVKGRAQLGIRFEEITLPNGVTRPLRATLSGFGGNGKEGFKRQESKVEGESTKGEDVGKVVQTTVTGAEIGTLAGLGADSTGKGLGIGSAAGAAGGLIWVLASRGKDVLLPTGTSLELQLGAPLTFEREELNSHEDYLEGPTPRPRDPGPGI
jgi:type IV secretion system protein VirB10